MRKSRIAPFLASGAAAALLSVSLPETAFGASGPTAAQHKLRWQRCDAGSPASFQCATLQVPLDYSDPGSGTIDIAISRVEAGSAKERRGVLLLNPGGPGGPGLGLPVDPTLSISEKVRRQYDLIGFDPRGVGHSSPLSCGLSDDDRDTERPYKAKTFARDVERARTVAAKCQAAAGGTLRHLTTRNTARDMDAIRAALGEKKISYLGMSYGTYLGAVYTQLFPRRADRFVLDSAADPAGYGRGMFTAMAKRAEPAFTRWTRWTARRHTAYGLGRTPAAVRRTFWDLVATADRTPIEDGGALWTGDDIRAQRAVFARVQKAAAWVAGLRKAADGKKPKESGQSPVPFPPVPPATSHDVPRDNEDAGAWAVLCADTRASWPSDPRQYRHDAIRDRIRYPLSGDFDANIKPCAFWKPGSEPRTAVNNKVPALIVQNEWDPLTPLAGGRAMHQALHGSRMVTVAGGEGHIVNGSNPCADTSAMAYLATGRLPAKDLTCRAD